MELGTADKSSIYSNLRTLLSYRGHEMLTSRAPSQALDSALVASKMIALRRLCLQWPFSLYCTLFSHLDHKRLYNFLADQTSCQVLALSMQMTKAQNVLRVATGWLLVTVFILRTLYRICLLKKSVSYWIGNEGYGVCMQKAII